jgi:endonuclease/exonuclease/phosphatase (EEP) superfamily protein YafD
MKEATILIYGYGLARVLPWLVCLRGVRCPYWLQTREWIFVPNLAANIVEVQTLGGIVLLGGDFNARTWALLDIIDINDLCELLQAPKLIETKHPGVVVKRQNRDTIVNG